MPWHDIVLPSGVLQLAHLTLNVPVETKALCDALADELTILGSFDIWMPWGQVEPAALGTVARVVDGGGAGDSQVITHDVTLLLS